MFKKKTKIGFLNSWKTAFWLTVGILLLFSVTPRGHAQALEGTSTQSGTGTDIGTSTEAAGSSTEVAQPVVVEPPVVAQPVVEVPPVIVPVILEPVPAPEPPPAVVGQIFPYTKKFIISSYYSPLPNQSVYFRGSYEADVRLNGDGVRAADNTVVYPGMAAAPKNFPFGTKMEIPGLGIVAVHDRGGAIKNNRIDIWMGQGEEGLRRAIGWGMRTLPVTVYGVDPNIHEAVDWSWVPLANLSEFLPKTKEFSLNLAEEDEGENVKQLQLSLQKAGFFKGEVTGYFGKETQTAVTALQLQEGVIKDTNDSGTGNFGPRTRLALENLMERLKTGKVSLVPAIQLSFGDSNESVSSLQTVLKDYGFLNEINGKFDEKTKEGLIRFQVDNDIVKSADDAGAGIYGPRTQSVLQSFVKNSFDSREVKRTVTVAPEQQPAGIFTAQLAFGDSGSDVVLVQEELRRLNFFGLEATGFFGKTTENAVIKFQQAFGIVEDQDAHGAGVIGYKTRNKLNEMVLARADRKRLIAQKTEGKEIVDSRIADERELIAAVAQASAFASDMIYGTRGGDVENLQKILKKLGFFQGRLTTQYFGDITKSALLAFQKSHGLDESGILDPTTRRILNKLIVPNQQS